jgi:hypothetical protein
MTVSLSQQIEEVERELAMRRGVYAKFVGRQRAHAEYYMQRMQAVLETLRWLQNHEELIRKAVSEMKALRVQLEELAEDDVEVS